MTIVETRSLSKTYGAGEVAVGALRDVSVRIGAGEFVAVMGPSGCGKSTLLHLLGGLDRPTSGDVLIAGRALAALPDDELAQLRRRTIGFVFQFYNLLPVLSALDNAALPLILDGMRPAEARTRAADWLRRVGLPDQFERHPSQLSGGQQQRVAIARAMAADPALVLADEPTGNLDTQSADSIAALLRQTASEWGRTVLMVTHDPRIAAHADRIIFLKDGTIVDDTRLAVAPAAAMEVVR